MPRNITITFNDGSAHRYENIPDVVTPDQIEARASRDFPGKRITNIDGRRPSTTSQYSQQPTSTTQSNTKYTTQQISNGVMSSLTSSLVRNLKDPESAKFRNLEVWETRTSQDKPNETSLMLFGEINAKNGYGAYGGFTPFYALAIEMPTSVSFHMIGMAEGRYTQTTYDMIKRYQSSGRLIWKQ